MRSHCQGRLFMRLQKVCTATKGKNEDASQCSRLRTQRRRGMAERSSIMEDWLTLADKIGMLDICAACSIRKAIMIAQGRTWTLSLAALHALASTLAGMSIQPAHLGCNQSADKASTL